ncbi:TonB-linked SusC/RagA family outer membrane protein [Dysgonomonas sp. PFB1-18]|uniref:SusC/RagA family TonB-linked outer membrane protein n=1 Tax=unclassified Dysgonomonas TaxID=2630389 RepID=UPI00247309D6|nr:MULTISPECIES: TonB-dependent receptor [unclassified Dysgonomonas]MDH6307950.1 TonB-linked SusC/RagA family outer membrane protein [Dysgonomonas sp. PF1-14]MDH6339489.1 TonB-linked SusC/RagA family outer membrane protein [Dysgonomonas sp. PF1-16]MDH6381140.1 TonB-linked SusC/RagA family outer membrane protein [Dysgonomonas sp. PFB1-18]MDH6398352.1 TonB-linked SusC/RagA family outer membrane protein [Dysgonomonas sp. PF1-23]
MQKAIKRILSLMCISLFLLGGQVYAQQRDVTGTVTDSQGEPLIGVTVSVKGTTKGTMTDIDGKYSLSVPAGSQTLVASYVGMKQNEKQVTANVIDFVMEDLSSELEEVVVIGYGTVKRKDLTGSVSSVKGDAIQAVPVSNVAEAITGKLAGVQVTTTEGSPDAEMMIRVRGGGSITQSNAPLYIVDGFPVESINDIASTDIESIDVLKDASSTAIYGSRGANGVIIVTTKSGKEGKLNVAYNAFVSWKKIAKKLDTLSPYDYATWQYERAMLDDGKPEKYTQFFGNYQDIDMYKEIEGNDWQEQIFGRTGFTFNHSLSLTGGGDKIKYSFNYSHVNDKAIMMLSGFKRDNLTLKVNSKPFKNLSLDFSARYSETETRGGGANEKNEKSSADSRLKNAMIYPPFPISGLTDEGNTDAEFNLQNPRLAVYDNDRFQERKVYNLNGSVTWEAISNLYLKAEVGLDDYRNNDDRFYGASTYYAKDKGSGYPALISQRTSRQTFRSTNTANYDFKTLLPESHNLTMLLGQEYIITKREMLENISHGFPASFSFTDALKLTSQGNAISINNNLYPDDILLSAFTRINYDYMSKYLVGLTFRADGSSKFAEGNKWGYFPSAAVAWRMSSESFMESTKTWLDDLKLRFSYGTAGNNNIPSGQMAQVYGVENTQYINGFPSYWAPLKDEDGKVTMANPDLKWETTITRNMGLDFTLLGGKLNGSLELYLNTTKDLLLAYETAGTGYDFQYRNIGKTQNKGLELSLNWVAIDKKDFGLSFGGNIAFNKNKVKDIGGMNYISGTSGWASTEIGMDYRIVAGGSIGEIYGYRSDGRYEVSDFTGYDGNNWVLDETKAPKMSGDLMDLVRPGTMKLKDLDGSGTVDDLDREVIGDTNPLHTGGFNINARAYGFDLSANFNWSYGNDVYNANKIEYTSSSKYHSRNMIAEMASGKRWTNLRADGTISNDPTELAAMNANTTMWSPYTKKYVLSDWAIEDGSFLRLSTLTLGYTLPQVLTRKVKMQNCRFYVTGYNVFCLTGYSGFDPEVSTRRKTALTPGVDYSAYPKSRSIVFGVNINF